MGIGDEIMASGRAKKLHVADPESRKVMIVDVRGQPRWATDPTGAGIWDGIGWIAHPVRDRGTNVLTMADGPRCRAYIDYKKGFTRGTGMNYVAGWRARDYRGFIQLSEAEMNFAADMAARLPPFVVIEPQVKTAANQNKQWGWAKWQSLANHLAAQGFHVIQIGPANTRRLEGVTLAVTPNFRHGAAVLKFSRWNFLPDGGLHHACAALGLPATVIWGGANDPEVLGYPDQVNIFKGPACLKWTPCRHCAEIWRNLTAEEVFNTTRPAMKERYGKNN